MIEKSSRQYVAELQIRIAEVEHERDELRARLDWDTCNSGHKTLPLVLWDCPVCAEIRVKGVEKERDLLRKAMLEEWEFYEDDGRYSLFKPFTSESTDEFNTPEEALAALVEKLKGEDDDA